MAPHLDPPRLALPADGEPRRRSPSKPEMLLTNHGYRVGVNGPPPATGDVTHGMTAFRWSGNDALEDCGYAAADSRTSYHQDRGARPDREVRRRDLGLLQAGVTGEVGTPPAPADQPDEGVEPDTWLNYCVSQGWIERWGELNPANVDEVHQAMTDFGGLLITADLTDDAEMLFSQHQPWTLDHGESADPNAGHFMVLAEYDPTSDWLITWAQLQQAMIAWDAACITGVYAIVTKEDAERLGINVATLDAEIASYNGQSTETPVSRACPRGLIILRRSSTMLRRSSRRSRP